MTDFDDVFVITDGLKLGKEQSMALWQGWWGKKESK